MAFRAGIAFVHTGGHGVDFATLSTARPPYSDLCTCQKPLPRDEAPRVETRMRRLVEAQGRTLSRETC